MKKFYLCMFFSVLLITFYRKDNIESVFNEYREGYYIYEFSFENQELNTFNFENYFLNYKVISITPYISPFYNKRLSNLENYRFSPHQSIAKNITNFEIQFVDALEEIGFRKEALKVKTSGISIIKVIVSVEQADIIEIQRNFPNVHYKLLDNWT